MTQTVIGIFDSPNTAYAAGDALVKQGIEQSSIYLSAKQGSAAGKGQSMDAIRNFLGELFGPEDSQDVDYFADEIDRGGVLLSVDVEDDADTESIRSAMQDAGAVDIEARRAGQAAQETEETSQTVPVVEEQMEIGKKQVGKGAVRVVSRMVETPVEKDVNLREEYASIKRHPVDQPISPEEVSALGGESIEVEETAEKPVVGKTARIVEEVEVGKETAERTETIADTERHTEVEVERQPAQGARRKGGKK